MNFFTCINDSLKTVHKNYQLIFIHFLFLFVSFFGLFFILSIPLGILFVIFGIDLTDILKGTFIEIIVSSLNLLKKFLIFAIIFLLTLFVYIFSMIALWIYIFSGTLGIMSAYLKNGILFKLKNFHRYGKKFFWRVAIFSIFSASMFSIIALIFVFLGDIISELVEHLSKFSHTISTFFNVFLYLVILMLSLISFLLWITYSLFGLYGIFTKNFYCKETIIETKKIIFLNPHSLGRATLLFVIYILAGGVLLSFGSLLAIIPNIGTILAAVYQFFIQFAHIYISLVVLAAFFSYYIRITEHYETKDIYSELIQKQEQVPLQEENLSQGQNPPA